MFKLLPAEPRTRHCEQINKGLHTTFGFLICLSWAATQDRTAKKSKDRQGERRGPSISSLNIIGSPSIEGAWNHSLTSYISVRAFEGSFKIEL